MSTLEGDLSSDRDHVIFIAIKSSADSCRVAAILLTTWTYDGGIFSGVFTYVGDLFRFWSYVSLYDANIVDVPVQDDEDLIAFLHCHVSVLLPPSAQLHVPTSERFGPWGLCPLSGLCAAAAWRRQTQMVFIAVWHRLVSLVRGPSCLQYSDDRDLASCPLV